MGILHSRNIDILPNKFKQLLLQDKQDMLLSPRLAPQGTGNAPPPPGDSAPTQTPSIQNLSTIPSLDTTNAPGTSTVPIFICEPPAPPPSLC